MKIDLTYKEANLLNAIIWELAEERSHVINGNFGGPLWRLGDKGVDLARSVAEKLEEANEAENDKRDKDRDLSGAPKGSIQDARWES